MGTFFIYILKSSVFLALFYLCYRILLSKETFHRFNRMVLLSSIVFSFLLPFIEVTWPRASEISQPFLLLEEALETVETKRLDVLTETPKRFTWNALTFLIYASGILFFFLRHVWSIMRMFRLLRNGRKEKMEDGITLYVHQAKVVPFSWMKLIAISEEDWAKHGEAILAHERAHIRYGHSWDLLLAQTCIFLQWFNPVAWLLKKELQIVHEYEADEHVVCNGMDASAYQLSIIEKAVGMKLFTIANSFTYSLLTKRVTMMNQKKSNRWARLKCLFVLPVAALAVVAFARPEAIPIQEVSFPKSKEVIVSQNVPEEKKPMLKGKSMKQEEMEEKVFMIVEELPQFPGGWGECIKIIQQNIQYPSDAVAENKEGLVLVTMIIRKDGSVANARIYKGVHPSLDREALRVVEHLPRCIAGKDKGENVNVYFTLPVRFKLKETSNNIS